MAVYSEERPQIRIGNGLYTAELSSSIPDGYVPEAYNLIATGETLENRQGFIQTSIDYGSLAASFGYYRRFYELVQFDPTKPALAWPDGTNIHFIRSSHGFTSGIPSGDGYMVVNPASGAVISLAQYRDRTYFSTETAVYAITAYNWSTDSITFGAVASSPANIQGLFSYKDRLWGFFEDKLYFTEVVSLSAAYPETWNSTTNFVPFRSDRGTGAIVSVVPLGNRLIIFTTVGAFTLLVEGTPASWIKKTLDVKSTSTRQGCAFEAQGIVYYVNTSGVFATNGLSTAKISGTIDDKFVQPDISLRHGLFYLDDGILLVISKIFKDGSGTSYLDSTNCRLFYSKLDPVAWTEWGIEGTEDYPSTFGSYNISEVTGVAANMNTFLSLSPITLLLLSTSRSTVASPKNSALQLVIYDGYQNSLKRHDDSSFLTISEPVKLNMITRFSDAGSVVQEKQLEYGYLEAYTSDANHEFYVKWVTDSDPSYRDVTHIQLPSVGDAVNLLKFPGRFKFRRTAVIVASQLQSNDSQVKLKTVHMGSTFTERNVAEDVR